MLIRPATHDDAAGIARVHIESWQTSYQTLLPSNYLLSLSVADRESRWKKILSVTDAQKQTFVAVIHEQLVGFVSCGPESSNDAEYLGEIYAIYLLSEFQRSGIGTQLFKTAVKFLLQHDFNSMKLWVLADNPSRRFYEHLGGSVVDDKFVEIGGAVLPAVAYGWRSLPLIQKSATQSG